MEEPVACFHCSSVPLSKIMSFAPCQLFQRPTLAPRASAFPSSVFRRALSFAATLTSNPFNICSAIKVPRRTDTRLTRVPSEMDCPEPFPVNICIDDVREGTILLLTGPNYSSNCRQRWLSRGEIFWLLCVCLFSWCCQGYLPRSKYCPRCKNCPVMEIETRMSRPHLWFPRTDYCTKVPQVFQQCVLSMLIFPHPTSQRNPRNTMPFDWSDQGVYYNWEIRWIPHFPFLDRGSAPVCNKTRCNRHDTACWKICMSFISLVLSLNN